jgi:GT2 family glycosyltransferase
VIIAKRSGISLTLIESSNVGYAGGLNKGIAALGSNTDTVMLANPDIAFGPTTIATLGSLLDEYPHVGAISPMIRNSAGEIAYAGWSIDPLSLAIRFCGLEPNDHFLCTTEVSHGAAVLVRRSALQQLVPFDEDFFLYREEAYLSFRLRRDGWSIGYSPTVTIIHPAGPSLNQYSQRLRLYYLSRSHLMFVRRELGLSRLRSTLRSIPILFRQQDQNASGVLHAIFRMLKYSLLPIVDFWRGKTGSNGE